MGWVMALIPFALLALGLPIFLILLVTAIVLLAFFMNVPYTVVPQMMFGSIDKFIEVTFGLPSLGQTDTRADDLSDCFNYSQTPTPYRAVTGVLPAGFFLAQKPDHRPVDAGWPGRGEGEPPPQAARMAASIAARRCGRGCGAGAGASIVVSRWRRA